ncbi:homoserine kinase [Advenella kashmirensis W13003]|uniref:Homoserine kinase n=1 Tax=Advenella kashmirensis W13003 TaxID=1424334 RepID=V8QSF6_9BURK|nr:homoserine kinase [Advenella kashmirensis]ETF02273.1 homoserine kinase [Advenella kashmirensis W13003]
MAVFTPVTNQQATDYLAQYALGDFVSLRGITAGIENTNFFLNTSQGEYVLTLFEVLNHEQLNFYIELMHTLASREVKVPMPQTRRDGTRIGTLNGKPAAIVDRLAGGYESDPGIQHCIIAGRTQAQAHLAARDFALYQPNLRGLPWWEETYPGIRPFLTDSQDRLFTASLEEQRQIQTGDDWKSMPAGACHCDLFRDNVLFDGTYDEPRMGGIIDFYFAGHDAWLFDVAVAVNDWCIERSTGALQPWLVQAWLQAYAQERPFTETEKKLWPIALRAAALRFWTSRLNDYFRPRPAQTLKPHDPTHFERILTLRVQQPVPPLP